MARRLTLVAMLAVALAGCNTVPSATDAGATDPVTPLSVPSDTPAPASDFSGPPGIAANGSVDPTALGRAHRAALGERSFTWTVEFDQRALDAGVRVDGVEKHLRVGSDGAYFIRTKRSVRERQLLYAADNRTYSRVVLDNRSIDRVDRRGQRFYRIHVTRPPAALRDGHPKQTIHNYTATAYVTPDGLVRALVVRYDYTLRDDHLEVTLRAEYDDLGETTVEPPTWAGAAVGGPTNTATVGDTSPQGYPPRVTEGNESGQRRVPSGLEVRADP